MGQKTKNCKTKKGGKDKEIRCLNYQMSQKLLAHAKEGFVNRDCVYVNEWINLHFLKYVINVLRGYGDPMQRKAPQGQTPFPLLSRSLKTTHKCFCS